ncbi:hypothetical protein HPB49_022793 [Dermacentor silvarum]|uniref:Uncharacterized protein n=1 Tax=Dermacentor silvarum TaxID=543639 RepID=A0ACB8C5S7_DERSI|nr:hypothetical protein HPB49_022793 [Dermacentor silvarum]
MPSFYKLLQESKVCLALVAIGRWNGLCGFVCSLWLLGMLPFSNYFRGELTSRLTSHGFPEQLDTLAKLERALDEKRVAPCVVKDSFLHQRLAGDNFVDTINKKLRLAFRAHEDHEELVQRTWVRCLKCALREDRICLAVSFPQWFYNPYKRSLVESQERLSPVFLTTSIRKNYPHRAAFRDLVRSIIETGNLRPPEETLKQGVLMNYREQLLVEIRPLQLEELASFFSVFMFMLALSAVACVLEIVSHRKNKPTDEDS